MKYPTFTSRKGKNKGEVQKFYNKLPEEEKKIIEDFLKYVSITAQSKKRLDNNRRCITEFRYVTNKSLKETNLDDLRTFLSILNNSSKTQATRNDLKASIKRFLKWYFKDWSKRFDNLSDIKLVMRMNEEKINADTLLKKEDVEKIMKEEKNLYWKTFFITLYESGLRPNELRTLKWSNVRLNVEGDITEINIFANKTHRARSVYVKEATPYLQELKKKAQLQEKNTDVIFTSPRDPNRPLSKDLASKWLGRISKKVLGRSIFPYLLRHSRATELYTNAGIPDKIAQKFLGHSKSMGDVYTHLSNTDIKEALGKTIYQFQDVLPEKKHQLEKELEETKGKLDELTRLRTLDVKAFATMLNDSQQKTLALIKEKYDLVEKDKKN